MSCGKPGRCCNGAECTENVGSCKCQSCGSGQWSVDNTCAPGACWITTDGAYSCSVLNPCECANAGGEFSGAGTACPPEDEGPPPPPPAPPPGPDPGPPKVYCCFMGACYEREYFCDIGKFISYRSSECERKCKNPPPDPPPPPDEPEPCDPPCNGCQTCRNGVCVSTCNTICCNGVCCPAGYQCVGGVCTPYTGCCLERWSACGAPDAVGPAPCVGRWVTNPMTGEPCYLSSSPISCDYNPFP